MELLFFRYLVFIMLFRERDEYFLLLCTPHVALFAYFFLFRFMFLLSRGGNTRYVLKISCY